MLGDVVVVVACLPRGGAAMDAYRFIVVEGTGQGALGIRNGAFLKLMLCCPSPPSLHTMVFCSLSALVLLLVTVLHYKCTCSPSSLLHWSVRCLCALLLPHSVWLSRKCSLSVLSHQHCRPHLLLWLGVSLLPSKTCLPHFIWVLRGSCCSYSCRVACCVCCMRRCALQLMSL